MVTTLRAYQLGLRRVYQAQRYVFVVYAINLIIALALGIILSQDIQNSLGNSMSAEHLRQGFDDLWYKSFSSSAQGVAKSFQPGVTGIGAIFSGLDNMLRGDFSIAKGMFGVAFLYWLLWIYLSAGFIGMFYNGSLDGVFGTHFFAEAGRFFLRFLMLAIFAAAFYALILYGVLPLLSKFITAINRDTIDERIVFKHTIIKYAIVWVLIFVVNLVFDYSKVIIIAEDIKKEDILRSPLLALKFIAQAPLKAALLYLLSGLTGFGLLLLYWMIAPGAWQSSWVTIMFAFLLGQIYILGRIAVRCLFYGGETALYYLQTMAPNGDIRRLPENVNE